MTAFYYTLHFSFRQIQTFSLRQAIFLCVNFYFDVLDIKKETLRSQLAWQRSTLAERKLATIVAK
ncbi:hypothetical protein ABH392_12985, partial [Staphylococcus aureus]|uniref:hypothetical protein n=1 Tax=Staphylococcus aureus TaxID=1280 RepID=UPI0024824761